MYIRWGNSLSDSFKVSNGVRQGSVLSPVLFSVYLDGFLEELGNSGVGCHWGCLFAGAICYADDIVLESNVQFTYWYCVARFDYICNLVSKRFCSFIVIRIPTYQVHFQNIIKPCIFFYWL